MDKGNEIAERGTGFSNCFLLTVQAYAMLFEIELSAKAGAAVGKIGKCLEVADSLPITDSYPDDHHRGLSLSEFVVIPSAMEEMSRAMGVDAVARAVVAYVYGSAPRPDWIPEGLL